MKHRIIGILRKHMVPVEDNWIISSQSKMTERGTTDLWINDPSKRKETIRPTRKRSKNLRSHHRRISFRRRRLGECHQRSPKDELLIYGSKDLSEEKPLDCGPKGEGQIKNRILRSQRHLFVYLGMGSWRCTIFLYDEPRSSDHQNKNH